MKLNVTSEFSLKNLTINLNQQQCFYDSEAAVLE